MEHNTDLWSCPYVDEKYGEERGASWKYFKCFLKCKNPRSLIEFHKVLSKNLSKKGIKRKPSYQTLMEYSAKWKWFMRAEAYDNYIHDVETEADKQKQLEIRRQAIQDIEERFNNHRQFTQELKEDTEMNINQKIYGFAKDTEGFKNNVTAFNELINEGTTKVDAGIAANIQSENIHKLEKSLDRLDDDDY